MRTLFLFSQFPKYTSWKYRTWMSKFCIQVTCNRLRSERLERWTCDLRVYCSKPFFHWFMGQAKKIFWAQVREIRAGFMTDSTDTNRSGIRTNPKWSGCLNKDCNLEWRVALLSAVCLTDRPSQSYTSGPSSAAVTFTCNRANPEFYAISLR